jgi:hypothetical protein
MLPHHRTYRHVSLVMRQYELRMGHDARQDVYRFPILATLDQSAVWSGQQTWKRVYEMVLSVFTFLGCGISQIFTAPVGLQNMYLSEVGAKSITQKFRRAHSRICFSFRICPTWFWRLQDGTFEAY